MNDIAPLMSIVDRARAREPRRLLKLCVVSSEFIGPVKNGGIGAATTGLVEQLARDGHEVTLLYTLVERGEPACAEQTWSHWADAMKAKGVRLEYIDHTEDYRSWRAKSWKVMEFVGSNEFDLVYFNEHHGNGYYSIAAKRAGIEPFASQIHCVIAHGAMEWVFDINDQYVNRPSDLELMGLERRSVEWADVVIGPSRYILEQYRNYGWALPERVFHQPLPLMHRPVRVDLDRIAKVDEIVFFGRLETRKGLWLFCEALDMLGEKLAGKRVTFLGRQTSESGLASGSLLLARSAKWPVRLRMLPNYGQEDALAYLKQEGRLAVMPSLADNSPCVIYECIENGIPFISTLGSGAQELVDRRDWEKAMVPPTAADLAAKLAEALDSGARFVRSSFDPVRNLENWSDWHDHVASGALPAKTDEGSRKQAASAASLLIIDGDCSVALLLRNIVSNVTRFGSRFQYGLVTQRQGEAKAAVAKILGTLRHAVMLFHPNDRETITEFLLRRPTAFFMDAAVELAAPFVQHAPIALERAVAASCVLAERRRGEDEVSIAALPIGDLPGVASLGYPIGSSVWACNTGDAGDLLAGFAYADERTDVTATSAELGQELMHACRARNLPISLVPLVGGLLTREEPCRPSPPRAAHLVSKRARATGIGETFYTGRAPWFALAAYGLADQGRTPLLNASELSDRHPLNTLRKSGTPLKAAHLAAAIGKPELALELAACQAMDKDGAKEIAEIAMDAIRERPRLELVGALSRAWEFGSGEGRIVQAVHKVDRAAQRLRSLLRTRGGTNGAEAQEAFNAAQRVPATTAYVDTSQVHLTGNTMSAADVRKNSSVGPLFFFDVPLAGHRELVAKLHLNTPATGEVRVLVADQQFGGVIDEADASLAAPETTIRLRLHGLFIDAMVVIQVKIAGRFSIDLESLSIS